MHGPFNTSLSPPPPPPEFQAPPPPPDFLAPPPPPDEFAPPPPPSPVNGQPPPWIEIKKKTNHSRILQDRKPLSIEELLKKKKEADELAAKV
jgi:ATP-dependent RNA helicase DDX23/PRP28